MKKSITYALLLFAALWSSVQRTSAQIYDAQGQYVDTVLHDHINRQAEDFVTVNLLVSDPTDWRDDMAGVCGHAFLRLQCPTFNMDHCLSYECEPLEGNVMRFLKGDLKMGLFSYTTQSQIEVYRKWHRTLHEYKLNLPPDAKQRLWKIMDDEVNNDIKLPLDMYKRGCAISLVHFVEEALAPKKIEYHEWPEELNKSRHDILMDALSDYPWLQLGARLFVYDKRFDRPCGKENKIINPALLVQAWQKATIDGHPLMTYQGDLVKGEKVVVEKTYFTPLVALILFLLLVVGVTGWIIWRKRNKKAMK